MIGVVPEILKHKAIFREIFDEGHQHVIGRRQLPVGWQVTSESKGGEPHGRQEQSEAFLSNGMDQQEADDKQHCAGYAMNGERSRPRPARPQND